MLHSFDIAMDREILITDKTPGWSVVLYSYYGNYGFYTAYSL